jgi:hypothetical protein
MPKTTKEKVNRLNVVDRPNAKINDVKELPCPQHGMKRTEDAENAPHCFMEKYPNMEDTDYGAELWDKMQDYDADSTNVAKIKECRKLVSKLHVVCIALCYSCYRCIDL